MSKIAIIAHNADTLIDFRGDLIAEMVKRGHSVKAFAPENDFESKINELGSDYEQILLERTGMNPIKDIASIFSIYNKLKNFKPDIVFSYAIKPVIYGGIASRLSGVNSINSLIPGVGSIFIDNDDSIIFKIVKLLYKTGLMKNDLVFFQNEDDRSLFNDLNLIAKNTETVIVNGSGVDTEYYHYCKQKSDEISFLFIGRLIEDKGINEYISAAEIIKKSYPNVKIKILGPFDSNPTAISKEDLNEYIDNNIIEYLGVVDDVRPIIKDSSIFVLPSFREGTPRSALEAMSMGRPIITTDVPGCREVIMNGVNGYMVPVKNAEKLAEAMIKFIDSPDLIESMGKESRKIAEEKYDVHKVNEKMLNYMNL